MGEHPEFILSARIFVPPRLTQQVRALTDRVKEFDDGSAILSFAVDHGEAKERQEAFEMHWDAILERVSSTPELVHILAEPGSFLELRLSLTPDQGGQSGLVLDVGRLRRWADLGGGIAVDCLP